MDGRWWVDRSFVYVGRMDASKGVGVIIRAYASLAAEYETLPTLWLVGGTPAEIEHLRGSLRDLIDPLEQRKLVEWWGFQRPAVISGLLSRSLVVLMHSQYEPGGRVVLEALASGLPVIATPSGFARELVRDWSTGFLVPYGDIDLLRTRMHHFIRQPLLRNAMGMRARALALDALSGWRFVDAHCDAYDEAIARMPAASAAVIPTFSPSSGDVLLKRTFAPTYPWSRAPADDGVIEAFVQRYQSSLRLLPRRSNADLLWTATDGAAEWVVKQVDANFEVRPLWDPGAGPELLRTAGDRFAAEVFSSSLTAFAPLASHSADHGLIMRPAGATLPMTQENIGSFERALRTLGKCEVPKSQPFRSCATSSPEVTWQSRLSELKNDPSLLGDDWTSSDTSTAERFADLSTRIDAPVVMTHGNPDPAHFVRFEGELLLISGGNLACAVIGKDLASLLLCVLMKFDVVTAASLLHDCEAGEADAVLAWAGLLSFEGIYRNAALRRSARVHCYRRLWSLSRELAFNVTR